MPSLHLNSSACADDASEAPTFEIDLYAEADLQLLAYATEPAMTWETLLFGGGDLALF